MYFSSETKQKDGEQFLAGNKYLHACNRCFFHKLIALPVLSFADLRKF